MIFNKIKNNYISDYKFDINQIVYKVTYNTLNSANKVVKHMQNNKKLYKSVVLLFAVCMLPQFAEYSMDAIVYIIRSLAMVERERMIHLVFDMLCELCRIVVSLVVSVELFKSVYRFLLNKFKIV